MHTPIIIQNVSIQYPHRTCFEGFSQHVHFGDRIAIIGANGSGKSSLLKAIYDNSSAIEGHIQIPVDIKMGYVPQLQENDSFLSGGEFFNKFFSEVLSTVPNCLLLDEPTNHLDQTNRKKLFEHIQFFYGTVIAVTHDVDFMNTCFDTLWHIDQGVIQVFSGKFDHYHQQRLQEKDQLEKQLKSLSQDKKKMHAKLMQEQSRASKSSKKGEKSIENKKWPTVVSAAKAQRSQETSGKKKLAISEQRHTILDAIESLNVPEAILPTFHVSSDKSYGVLVQIQEGSIGYGDKKILSDIHLMMHAQDKVVIEGDNGSGKTSLIKAIMHHADILREGEWHCTPIQNIGYLDQHYKQLPHGLTVLEALKLIVPKWESTALHRHLAEFLFKGAESVNLLVDHLSGGERARLSLALIAAKPPKLLILDEVTNNVDLETVNHLIEVLSKFPGAMLIISHHHYFLNQLPIHKKLVLKDGVCAEVSL